MVSCLISGEAGCPIDGAVSCPSGVEEESHFREADLVVVLEDPVVALEDLAV